MLDFIHLDDTKTRKRLGCLVTFFGDLQYIMVTITAMVLYPGGYSFFTDDFSSLGRFMTSPLTSVIFCITLTIVAIFQIPFWIVIDSLFKKSESNRTMSRIGTILGAGSSIPMIGTGLFPADLFTLAHNIFSGMFFVQFAGAMICYSIVFIKEEKYHNGYAIIGFAVVGLVVFYPFGFLFIIQAALQKIIVYSFIAYGWTQIVNVWRALDTENVKSS